MVPELGGTTTVVFFCGAGGLLLLMHAERLMSMHIEANTIFMVVFPFKWLRVFTLTTCETLASHPPTAPTVSVILPGRL